jgi:two-component system KDP operon response regulator KdpE
MGVATARKIVVIEDEPQMRRFLVMLARSHGFDVFEAGRAADGISAITEHDPDIVLLDLVLPDSDGLEQAPPRSRAHGSAPPEDRGRSCAPAFDPHRDGRRLSVRR